MSHSQGHGGYQESMSATRYTRRILVFALVVATVLGFAQVRLFKGEPLPTPPGVLVYDVRP
jgi:hypothetical protein